MHPEIEAASSVAMMTRRVFMVLLTTGLTV
jgi:hypothetical protein